MDDEERAYDFLDDWFGPVEKEHCDALVALIRSVRAEEREACAKTINAYAERHKLSGDPFSASGMISGIRIAVLADAAAAIRARGDADAS